MLPMLQEFREQKAEVERAIERTSRLARSIGAKSLAERVDKDLVQKLREDRFHLVVVGEFNHGKSTFVNALLGETVLPTGVTPTTAAIHHLSWAETPRATVVLANGERRPLPFAETRTFAVGGGADPGEVDYLEVGFPAKLLEERIVLVDTPGVNDLSLQRSDITYSYVPRADAVLFLLDAGQILKESERVFLQDKLLKASRDKIVFVVTKWDILSPEERAEALAYAKKQLATLVKDPVVFPVSAEQALSGAREASGMPELLAHLTTFLAEQRGRILLDNAVGEGLTAVSLLEHGVDARRRALAMDAGELDRRIAALEKDLDGQAVTLEQRRATLREAIGGIKTGAQKDLERFVDETLRQLPTVIDAAKPSDLKDHLPAFLEDTFRRWAEAESKEIADQLEALAERTVALVRDDAREASQRVAERLGSDVKKLDVRVDTFRYDAGVAAVLAVGVGLLFVNALLGGLLTIAAPLLAFVFRGRIDAEYKDRAKEAAPEVLREAARQVAPKLDAMIEEFAVQLDAFVVGAGAELYREIFEVLGSSKAARAAGAESADAARAELEVGGRDLAEARVELEQLRARLGVQPPPVSGKEGAAAPPAGEPPRVRVEANDAAPSA